MKVLYGQDLVNELRKLADSVTDRLWIAVPYMGNPSVVKRILGKEWFDNPSVNVKLLTDISDLTCLDTDTIKIFYDRGQVKTLLGLHAKIYIVDDTCLVTSANLTKTAFSKRHEIGMLYSSVEAKQTIRIFNEWWNKSEDIDKEKLNKIFSVKNTSKEDIRTALPDIYNLPNEPGIFVKNPFLQYDRIVLDYEDFSKKYSSIQRIWTKQPLYFEIDGFLDYLYHKETKPSKDYATKAPRVLTDKLQIKEIEKWALRFKKWAKEQPNNDWRLENSQIINKKLSPKSVKSLTKAEILEVLLQTNAGKSRRKNPNLVINTNKISDIRNSLDILVNANNLELAERFSHCIEINGLGPSMMNELLGFYDPDKYPLINKNSICGLRFFGYPLSFYN